MYVKGKYSWLKHLDFMLIDLLVLIFSFSTYAIGSISESEYTCFAPLLLYNSEI